MTASTVLEPPHLQSDLRTLCLPAVATHWKRLSEEARRARQSPADYLAELMSLEVQQRREKRIQRRINEARFPMLKTLDTFDFATQRAVDREALLELARAGFVAEHANVVLIGGVGTGKTHLAIALGVACCQREHRVRYTTAAELTNTLVEAQREGKLSRKLEQLSRFEVLVLDELGYVPFDKLSADLLFGLVSKVRNVSMILRQVGGEFSD
jgi:DNA replication protein DnaC